MSVFQIKTFQFCVIARSAATWQSESRRHGIPWRSTGVRNKKNSLSQKQGNRCFVSRPLSLFQGSVSFRATIVRFGMTNRSVKDCRVGRKMRPPRNDRIGRLDRKYGTRNSIFGFRKTSLICCLILTVPDFFDSVKEVKCGALPCTSLLLRAACFPRDPLIQLQERSARDFVPD